MSGRPESKNKKNVSYDRTDVMISGITELDSDFKLDLMFYI